MVAGIVGGRLGDSYPQHTKIIVVLSVFCMILGNIQYLVGGSVVNLIMGRVVCGQYCILSPHRSISHLLLLLGLGSGAGAALLAEVCRTSSTKERTSILSICNGLRQIGLLTSPGFQILLEQLDFSLFDGLIVVGPYNASGLLMAVLWILYLIFTLLFYQNLDVEYKYELLRQEHIGGEDITGESLELSETHCLVGGNESSLDTSPRQSWFYLDDIYREVTVDHPITCATYINGELLCLI